MDIILLKNAWEKIAVCVAVRSAVRHTSCRSAWCAVAWRWAYIEGMLQLQRRPPPAAPTGLPAVARWPMSVAPITNGQSPPDSEGSLDLVAGLELSP